MSSSETTPECRKEGLTTGQGVPVVPTIKGSKSSSDLSPNSQSSPGSPETGPIYTGIGRPVSSDFVDVPIFQVTDSSVFVLMTFPTASQITAVAGITATRQNLHPQYKVASPYGDTTGFNFDETTRFVPGDYCLGLVFRSSEEAQSISMVRLLLQAEPVSNFMVAQMIFGLCRSLGFEPSHVMKYPARSSNASQPFYRKIRSEISKLAERVGGLEAAVRSKEETLGPQLISRIDLLESTVRSKEDSTSQLLGALEAAVRAKEENLGSQVLERLTLLESAVRAKEENLGPQLISRIDLLESAVRAKEENLGPQVLERLTLLESTVRAKEDSTSRQISSLESAVRAKEENFGPQLTELSRKLDPRLSRLESLVTEIKGQPIVTVEQIQEQFRRTADSRQEKGSSEPVPIEMIEQLILEKETYLNKLREAEDYIDQLMNEEEKKPAKPVQWFQPGWDSKKSVRR